MNKYLYIFFALFISFSVFAQEGLVWKLDFKNTAVGPLTEAELIAEGGTMWTYLNNNSYVVEDDERGKVLKIKYPQGAVGPTSETGGYSGSQFIKTLSSSTEYYLDYYVKFEDGFEFVKGGKLPGLTSDGSAWTGGQKPTNGQGFSARYMWVQNGKMLLYFYYWDMAPDFEWKFPLGVDFEIGKWYRLTQRIKLNTSNTSSDGILQVWVDGSMVINRNDIRYMAVGKKDIDSFYFSTFYGGASSDWAPSNDTYTRFDKMVVSTKIPDFSEDGATSNQSWKTFNVEDFSNTFSVEYDLKPLENNMDGVTGIVKGNATNYPDLSCIVRLKPDGTLDAYDDNVYKADNIIYYNTSNLFHVKMQIDVVSQTYDVYVSKDGGEDITLASGYKFRNKNIDLLNSWSIYAYVGSHKISNMVFKDGGLSNTSHEFSKIKIYPTVITNNELTLKTNNYITSRDFNLTLLSVDGRVIESQSISVNSVETKLIFNSLVNQKQGVYLLHIKNNGNNKLIKLIKN